MDTIIVAGLIGAGIACTFFLGKPTTPKDQYILRTLKAPKVNLKVFVAILEFPILGSLLCKLLYKSNLFHTLHEVNTMAPPTFIPIVPPTTLPKEEEKDFVSCEEFLRDVLDICNSKPESFASIIDYALAYRTGKTTPLIVAHNVVKAIEISNNLDHPLNAFISVHADEILEQARRSTALYDAHNPRSLLEGVPVGVKDEFDMVDYPTTVGTAYIKTVARQDATVVKRLRDLGAILIGKCNMHEIGFSTVGHNPHHGTPRNPFDPSRHCGGSSAGSAAAVAAGLCPVAVGADGGGSIRVPAGLCGLVGLKATFGRVSEFGAYPLCWTVAHAGPIACCVQDCAIAYAAMCGPDDRDGNTTHQPLPKIPRFSTISTETPLEGIRIGIYEAWSTHANENMVNAYNHVIEVMCRMGAVKKNVVVLGDLLEKSRIAHSLVIGSEITNSVNYYYHNNRKAMGFDVRASMAVLQKGSAIDYIQANRIFEEVDVLITPNTAVEAPKITSDSQMDIELMSLLMRFAFLGNFTGLPAIVLPAAYADIQGCAVPLGVQLMGRWWEEHTLLKIAYVVEKEVNRKAPKVHFKILGN